MLKLWLEISILLHQEKKEATKLERADGHGLGREKHKEELNPNRKQTKIEKERHAPPLGGNWIFNRPGWWALS